MLNQSATFQKLLTTADGRPSGFDYLRIALAVSVLFWHSFGVSYGIPWGYAVLDTAWRPAISFVLPSFFALSGFLIAGSLERSSLTTFVGLRMVRILPALSVETFVSAFILGPLFTTYALADYFADGLTHRYLFNLIGHIQYHLPGLFADNPIPDVVNAQLWTVPWELKCYLAIFLLALFGLARNRLRFMLSGVVIPILYVFGQILMTQDQRDLGMLGQVTGQSLVLCFLCGIGLQKYKDAIPHSLLLTIVAAVLFTTSLYWRFGEAFLALPVAYITAYIGLLNPRKIWLIRKGDYSYGIFLYGFAIQQAAAQFAYLREWHTNFIISLMISGVLAAISWHFIEKPSLGLRKHFGKVEAYVAIASDRLLERIRST